MPEVLKSLVTFMSQLQNLVKLKENQLVGSSINFHDDVSPKETKPRNQLAAGLAQHQVREERDIFVQFPPSHTIRCTHELDCKIEVGNTFCSMRIEL